ncbi:ribose 5-phosphate isomerase B [bacterium]|nr:ribose 5-phosphate isomerase B [candidate division CSSED10-310 bacterium]
MKIAIGNDHGGFEMKIELKQHLEELHHTIIDCGCSSTDSVDYPDFAVAVARKVALREAEIGIMIDGAGVGSAMAANKIVGIRAALCNDIYTAKNAREHNDANILTLGSMVIGPGKAKLIVDTFLNSTFLGDRHQRRVDKIMALDGGRKENNNQMEHLIHKITQDVMTAIGAQEKPPQRVSSAETQVQPRLITEDYLREQLKKGIKEIHLNSGTLVTPLARDYARDHGLRFI